MYVFMSMYIHTCYKNTRSHVTLHTAGSQHHVILSLRIHTYVSLSLFLFVIHIQMHTCTRTHTLSRHTTHSSRPTLRTWHRCWNALRIRCASSLSMDTWSRVTRRRARYLARQSGFRAIFLVRVHVTFYAVCMYVCMYVCCMYVWIFICVCICM